MAPPDLSGMPVTVSLEAIARVHFQELVEERGVSFKKWLPAGCAVVPLAGILTLFNEGWAVALVLLWFASWPVSAITRSLWVSRSMAKFESGDTVAVVPVYEKAVGIFRLQIKRHRARTLGRKSEWGRARTSLAKKKERATQQVLYWQTRLKQEPGNELAETQLKTAEAVSYKLRSAMTKLDARAKALLRFYNECEVKLDMMDRHNSDLEKTRRLEELSGAADIAIGAAHGTLDEIGRQFLQEANALGRVLGGLEGVQIKALAGEADLDNMEYLADQIIERSEADRKTVENLEHALHQL